MGLDKPPPSRYRIEEKDGRLIVHDSMASGQMSPSAPEPQPRSALSGVSNSPSVSSSLSSPAPTTPSSGMGGGNAGVDSGKAKRGGTVAAFGFILALFLFITNLWPMLVLAMLIPPVRKKLLGSILPAVKRFIDEGRVS
jgi:hypothetical protein